MCNSPQTSVSHRAVVRIGACAFFERDPALVDRLARVVSSSQVAFDIFVLIMVFVNAVDRPYRQNSELVRNLRRDGMKFFSVSTLLSALNRSSDWSIDPLYYGEQALLLVRSTNLVLAIFSPVSVLIFYSIPRLPTENQLTLVLTSAHRSLCDYFVHTFQTHYPTSAPLTRPLHPQLPMGHLIGNALSTPPLDQSRGKGIGLGEGRRRQPRFHHTSHGLHRDVWRRR